MKAVRVHEGVDLLEFDVPEDRVLPIVDETRSDEEHRRQTIAFGWHMAQQAGWSETRWRWQLHEDPELAPYAEDLIEAWEPPASLTTAEAERLVSESLAEPIEED